MSLNDSKDINKLRQFDIDLEFGKDWEVFIDNMFKGFTSCEVKTEKDIWSKTGNLVVEFKSRGKYSGIANTQADLWVQNFVSKDKHIFSLVLTTDMLKKYIRENKPKQITGGDYKTSLMFLIRIRHLVNWLIQLEE